MEDAATTEQPLQWQFWKRYPNLWSELEPLKGTWSKLREWLCRKFLPEKDTIALSLAPNLSAILQKSKIKENNVNIES